MHRTPAFITSLLFLGIALNLGSTSGCGGSDKSQFAGGDGGLGGDGSLGSSSGLFGSSSGTGGGGDGASSGAVATQCPTGTECNVSCSSGTTSITGKVYDPALKNGLYNVAVYVPGGAMQPLPKGVPTGSAACNCNALFPSGAVVSTATAVDGTFKLANAPVGKSVPLVLQIGKWRRVLSIDTTQCTDNAQPDKSLSLPGTLTGAGPDDNMPDIAVSTGSADTLECLMRRIGLPAAEYVAGSGSTGHVHVFSGGDPAGKGKGGGVGTQEKTPMANAPESSTTLWDKQADLMPYDIVLLSCEGGETYNANPAALEEYLNAGGRAFASHFHYAWFSGPISSKGTNTYTAPSDWGTNLATWSADGSDNNSEADGQIVQTLNGSTTAFPKGQALFQWLGNVGALGVQSAPAQDLPIFQPRYNAQVGAGDKPSQPWINDSASSNTMYFSFDTPVGASNYCGRAVFSDLHVSGDTTSPYKADNTAVAPPASCTDEALSPQEAALEFMLFDLSSCVIPDTQAPSTTGVPVVQ